MRTFRCPRCRGIAFLESLTCPSCELDIALHLPSLTMIEADPAGTTVDGEAWFPCVNRTWECSWAVADGSTDARCVSCALTRRRPDAGDTIALEKLASTGRAKRHLLVQLHRFGLPITPWHRRPGGLGFDLLSSRSGNGPVTIGHASGIITIDLAETLDDHRERLRVSLGEPYRTMLGHFRHESGHYYQWILVEQTDFLAESRELFGDERASYSDAIARHYAHGAPSGWIDSYISEYATMHPWEDFAETWAHYFHITDTLDTVALAGVRLEQAHLPDLLTRDIEPRRSYAGVATATMLEDWYWISKVLNQANRAMGKGDLYPFGIVAAVAGKLDFVHRVVQASAVATPWDAA